jgi:hypothetical protein
MEQINLFKLAFLEGAILASWLRMIPSILSSTSSRGRFLRDELEDELVIGNGSVIAFILFLLMLKG